MNTQPPPRDVWGNSAGPPQKAAPRTLWYIVGSVVLTLGLGLGAWLGIGGLVKIFDMTPGPNDTFSSSGSTTAHFAADETKVVFLASDAGGHPVRCQVRGQSGEDALVERSPGSLSLNQWTAYFTVTAAAAGDYQIGCMGAPSDRFGLGGDVTPGDLIASVLFIVLGGILTVIGLISLLVTAVLRNRRSVRR